MSVHDSDLTPERVDAALEAANIGVWEMDFTTHLFTCSARCRELFGLPVIGLVTLEDVLGAAHPEEQLMVKQNLAQALDPKGTGYLVLEHRVLLPSGEERWVRSTGLAVFDQKRKRPIRFQGITKDITNTHANKVLTDQRRQEFDFLAESLPTILWTASPDGSLTYCNTCWQLYTGHAAEEAVRKGWEAVLHPEDLVLHVKNWIVLPNNQPFEIESRFRHHSGEYRWFNTRLLPLRNTAGEIIKWFGICIDVHKQKEMEEVLRRVHQEIEHVVESRTRALQDEVVTLRRQLYDSGQ